MEGFREVLNRCSLGELRFVGQWYTWERGRSPKTRIRERLDRFLVSYSWMQLFPQAYIEHTLRYSSDHSAIVLKGDVSRQHQRGSAGFRFETSWLLDTTCEEVVRGAWAKSSGGVITDRLGEMARELQAWSKKGFGNLGKQIRDIEKRLHLVQSKPVTEDSCKECSMLEMELDSLNAKNRHTGISVPELLR